MACQMLSPLSSLIPVCISSTVHYSSTFSSYPISSLSLLHFPRRRGAVEASRCTVIKSPANPHSLMNGANLGFIASVYYLVTQNCTQILSATSSFWYAFPSWTNSEIPWTYLKEVMIWGDGRRKRKPKGSVKKEIDRHFYIFFHLFSML